MPWGRNLPIFDFADSGKYGVISGKINSTFFSKQGRRKDTLFYKVVLGGNDEVVKDVLDWLEAANQTEVLEWLLDSRDKQQAPTGLSKKGEYTQHTEIAFLNKCM